MSAGVEKIGTWTTDEAKWFETWLDTPFSFPGAGSPQEAMKIPGCCVKTRGFQIGKDDPIQRTGKLVVYDEDKNLVLVRGHGDAPWSPKFVWTGTIAQYTRAWVCD